MLPHKNMSKAALLQVIDKALAELNIANELADSYKRDYVILATQIQDCERCCEALIKEVGITEAERLIPDEFI